MNGNALVEVIEGQAGLDRLAEGVQGPVSRVLAQSPRLRSALDGTWLGHSVHAAVTDVPVGAWTAGVVLDVLEVAGRRDERRRGDAVHAVGLAAAMGAAVTGLADWSYTSGRTRRVGLVHAGSNLVVAALFGASLWARSRGRRGAGIALSTAGYGLLLFSSWLGGELAYRYGVGVSRTAFEPEGPEEWTAVLDDAALPEGGLRRVDAGGAPVLLARYGGRLFAIGDTCPHMGCSLSEGRLAGQEIVCACHGSRFRLADGQVTGGPATISAPSFDVRVEAGRIEVCRPRRARAQAPAAA